eukprot:757661-Hanusia_phi.AAC.1
MEDVCGEARGRSCCVLLGGGGEATRSGGDRGVGVCPGPRRAVSAHGRAPQEAILDRGGEGSTPPGVSRQEQDVAHAEAGDHRAVRDDDVDEPDRDRGDLRAEPVGDLQDPEARQ